ncbi:MAG: hypothetical protein ACRDZP_09765, partial [Acidimicrobiales bacterium]
VPAGPSYGVLLHDGSIWYPGSRKKLPAPLLLRIFVWALAFLVILAAAADFIVHTHPSWVDPMRRSVAVSQWVSNTRGGGAAVSHTATSSPPASSSSIPAVHETYPQPAGIPAATTAYSLPALTSYEIVVKSSGVAWVTAYPLTSGQDQSPALFQGVLQAGQTETINAKGPADLFIAASGTTVSIVSNGKQVGTLGASPRVPWHFWLQPAS